MHSAKRKAAIGLRKQVLALNTEYVECARLQHVRTSHHAEIVGDRAFPIARVHRQRKDAESRITLGDADLRDPLVNISAGKRVIEADIRRQLGVHRPQSRLVVGLDRADRVYHARADVSSEPHQGVQPSRVDALPRRGCGVWTPCQVRR